MDIFLVSISSISSPHFAVVVDGKRSDSLQCNDEVENSDQNDGGDKIDNISAFINKKPKGFNAQWPSHDRVSFA